MTRFIVDDDVPSPTKGAGGRPRDPRLASICERAAKGIKCGEWKDAREAANEFASEYAGKSYDVGDRIRHNELTNDLRKMIERHIAEVSHRSAV